MTTEGRKTHEEYMALARVLGEHAGLEMYLGDPLIRAANLAIHALTSKPRCPLCMEQLAKVKDITSDSPNGGR